MFSKNRSFLDEEVIVTPCQFSWVDGWMGGWADGWVGGCFHIGLVKIK